MSSNFNVCITEDFVASLPFEMSLRHGCCNYVASFFLYCVLRLGGHRIDKKWQGDILLIEPGVVVVHWVSLFRFYIIFVEKILIRMSLFCTGVFVLVGITFKSKKIIEGCVVCGYRVNLLGFCIICVEAIFIRRPFCLHNAHGVIVFVDIVLKSTFL